MLTVFSLIVFIIAGVALKKLLSKHPIFSAVSSVALPLVVLLGVYVTLRFIPIPEKILPVSEKVLLTIALVLGTIAIVNLVEALSSKYINMARFKELLPAATVVKTAIKVTIWAIGILVVLQTMGISITPLLTTLGLGGLAVALALQDTLGNLFAGMQVLASKQIRVGDYVKLETGEEGHVMDITWRNTTIRTIYNNVIVIPNSKLATTVVENYHLPRKRVTITVDVGVSYASDLEKVERVTLQVAKEVQKKVPGAVADFEPFIRYYSFGDFSINFKVYLQAKEYTDHHLIRHEFIKRLHRRYKKENIEIPFPIRTVFLKSEEGGREDAESKNSQRSRKKVQIHSQRKNKAPESFPQPSGQKENIKT